MDTLPTLETPRLVLRPTVAEDAPDLLAMVTDPEVLRYWGNSPVVDLETARVRIAQIHTFFVERSGLQWAITRRGEDRFIGSCTIFHLDRENRRGEVGYGLVPACWGKGYATEAVARLLELSFETLDLHRLEADVDPRNARSLAVLERLGFQREGYLRERWLLRGEIQDTVLLGLLAREWRAGRQATK